MLYWVVPEAAQNVWLNSADTVFSFGDAPGLWNHCFFEVPLMNELDQLFVGAYASTNSFVHVRYLFKSEGYSRLSLKSRDLSFY